MVAAGSRVHELRVSSLADARVRDAVAAVLGQWVAPPAGPIDSRRLERTGILIRLPLRDAEAVALLRDLYGTGIAPAAVVLRPVEAGTPRDRAGAAPAFAVFARRGGRFAPTWNWTAFVFGPLWYLRRGLYGKGLILLALSVCPLFGLAVTLLLSGVILVYCGVAGNWDDYLWRVKGTQWW